MNDIERAKGERLAAGAMKVLATIGLVALLALTAWVAVTLVRVIPDAGQNVRSAVLTVQSIFGAVTADEALRIELERRTLVSGSDTTVTWVHEGAATPQAYLFSYSCADSATFTVRTGATTERIACDTPFRTTEQSLILTPESTMNRYLDVTFTVTTEDERLKDDASVTIENLTVADSRSSLASSTDNVATTSPAARPPEEPEVREPRTPVTAAPPVTPAPVRQTFPRNPSVPTSGPADLAVTIDATGIVLRESGNDTFVALSTIPSDTVAAVRFTVVNRGGVASEPWGFVANLPVEGDADYRFTSPLQTSLAPGMQVQYTLSFDEVANTKTGAIKIELRPATKSDPATNNMDALLISIKEQ